MIAVVLTIWCKGHKTNSIAASMVHLDVLDTAYLVVLGPGIFSYGTIDRAKLGCGVTMVAAGIDFPGDIVNTACMSRAVEVF
jgi:hypothetical protein